MLERASVTPELGKITVNRYYHGIESPLTDRISSHEAWKLGKDILAAIEHSEDEIHIHWSTGGIEIRPISEQEYPRYRKFAINLMVKAALLANNLDWQEEVDELQSGGTNAH